MKCPKCEGPRLPEAVKCPSCGIIYEKYDPLAAAKLAVIRARLDAKRQVAPLPSERPQVAERSQAVAIPLSSRIRMNIQRFCLFAATEKGRAVFGVIGAAAVLAPPRTLEGQTAGLLVPLLLAFVLSRQPAVRKSEVTTCPACSGQVAYGVKSCPHCGKAKPAPKKIAVGPIGMMVAGMFCGLMMLSAANTPTTSGPSWAEKTAIANKPLIREQAVLAIKAAGYWCDTLDTFGPMATRPGFKAQCNNYRYAYTIEQDGPRILVKPD